MQPRSAAQICGKRGAGGQRMRLRARPPPGFFPIALPDAVGAVDARDPAAHEEEGGVPHPAGQSSSGLEDAPRWLRRVASSFGFLSTEGAGNGRQGLLIRLKRIYNF